VEDGSVHAAVCKAIAIVAPEEVSVSSLVATAFWRIIMNVPDVTP
jgi:hypothetical protein